MKLYKYTFGDFESYGSAKDDTDAFERRISIDPQFHYVPVTIEEVTLEGYKITVTPQFFGNREDQEHIMKMDRDQLKTFLADSGIEFVPQWGDKKLMEVALNV